MLQIAQTISHKHSPWWAGLLCCAASGQVLACFVAFLVGARCNASEPKNETANLDSR